METDILMDCENTKNTEKNWSVPSVLNAGDNGLNAVAHGGNTGNNPAILKNENLKNRPHLFSTCSLNRIGASGMTAWPFLTWNFNLQLNCKIFWIEFVGRCPSRMKIVQI
jgi:hypothetical protein